MNNPHDLCDPNLFEPDLGELRLELNVSRLTIADWAGVTQNMIGKVERGDRRLSEASLECLRQMVGFARATIPEKRAILAASSIIDRLTIGDPEKVRTFNPKVENF